MARVRGTHVWLPRPDGFIDTPQYPRMRGYELVAYGKDRYTDRALVIYQLLMAIPEGFLLVQGRANAAAPEDLLPRMRSAARSVRRTR